MRIVIALGGNALLRRGEPAEADTQRRNVATAVTAIADLAADHEVIVTHGNGPQVGLLALQGDAYDAVTPYPLDVLGAESEGQIGYLLDQELVNALGGRPVATLLTQVIVDLDDPGFAHPTKPIGPVYDRETAERLAAERGWAIAPDGPHYRRVVASPEPRSIVELETLRLLVDAGVLVVCVGGGGIPVAVDLDGRLRGVEAVIDKDLAAALLARGLGADALLLLTDVPAVQADWGTPQARAITRLATSELRQLVVRRRLDGPQGRGGVPLRRGHPRDRRHRRARRRARDPAAASAVRRSRLPSASPARNSMRCGRPDRRLMGAVAAVVAVAALYLALPAIAGLDETWRLLKSGNAWWLGLGVALELGSYAGYVLLFRRVFGEGRRHRLPAQPRDHARRRRGDPPARDRRRRRRRADRLGAAPLGHGTRGRGQRAHDLPCRALLRLHGRAGGDGAWAALRSPAGARAVRADRRPGRVRRAGHRHRARGGERARRPARAAVRRAPRRPARRPGLPRWRAVSAGRCACCELATPASSAPSPGGVSTSPSCGRASTPSAEPRRSRSSCSSTSSACSPTRSRSPAGLAAWRAG